MVTVDIEPAGVTVYLAITTASIVAAYFSHPFLLESADWLLDLGSEVDVKQSVNFFFTLVAVVYGIIVGSTFSICYERQVSLVAELYKEILILEHLLQCTLVDVADPQLRKRMAAAVRRYVSEEVRTPHRKAVDSPFAFDSSYNALVQAITAVSDGGCTTTSLVAWCRKLAGAQSDRSTVMALVLPVFHWVFMIAMQFLFLICFLVFDAASGIEAATITAERKFNFSGLVGTLVLIQMVLFDLNNPVGGLYSFQAKLDERLAYLAQVLDELETQPAGWAPEEVVQLQKLGFTSTTNSD